MDPKTGAIKKEYGIPNYTVAYDESGKRCVSHKFKIKNVCERCLLNIYESVFNGQMRPLHHAVHCVSCEEREVRQPYAEICSLCSVVRKKCVKCLETHDEYKGRDNPLEVILDEDIKEKIATLPVKYRRRPVRIVLKKWKKYLEKKFTVEDIRQRVLQNVNDLNLIATGVPNEIE